MKRPQAERLALPGMGLDGDLSWSPPETFPDLSSAKAISVDVETRDDDLPKLGPGTRRGAYIVGISIATDDGFAGYFPIAHDQGPRLDRDRVFAWLREELSRPHQVKVGSNLLYDAEHLAFARVELAGRWVDVQIAEALLDEDSIEGYGLDATAFRRLGKRKETEGIEREAQRMGLPKDARNHLWRMDSRIVGPYAERDATLPLEIMDAQAPLLERDDLLRVYDVENRLLPLLVAMRIIGTRIDVENVERAMIGIAARQQEAQERLDALADGRVDVWSAESIAAAFDRVGISYPKTPKGAPSFRKGWLESQDNAIARELAQVRSLDKFHDTFLDGALRRHAIGGRVFPSFHPMKADDHGTVVGRLSCSNPNVQQIPARDEILGPMCRSLFVPDEGCDWGALDYSQVELRVLAHFAIGEGADRFRAAYRENPETDFHEWCANEAGVSRYRAKTTNFGLVYGMGARKLAASLGMSAEEGRDFLERYHKALPFARATAGAADRVAQARGWVKTILGRRRRFDSWEPAKQDGERRMYRTKEEAIEKSANGKVKRAMTHKALHHVVCGSAADLAKTAMVLAWEGGLFNVLSPHFTVHDELDVSVPRTKEGREAFDELANVMETAIKFDVPILVEKGLGANWAEAKG